MAPKVMLFAGAPAPSTVHEESCTITNIDPRIAKFLGLDASVPDEKASQSRSFQGITVAPWRSLALHARPRYPGFSQVHQIADTSTSFHDNNFFTTADASYHIQGASRSFEDTENVLTQFCEQSLAVHNSIPSSQLDGETYDPDITSFEETSFLTTTSFSKTDVTPLALGVSSHLSDLEDIPPPRDITAAIPSTITVNLIVGIISIAQPRTVTTRWGRQLSLIEVLVGDDTKSGFAITFWLSSDSISESQLSKLRRQDVVLLRNVALHVFRNKVYGQSLRKGLTQINLLWRRDGSGHYSTRHLNKNSQKDPQVEKTKKTKDWVLGSVGVDQISKTGKKRPRKSWDQPPEDTQ